jgi:hypothetical protein
MVREPVVVDVEHGAVAAAWAAYAQLGFASALQG